MTTQTKRKVSAATSQAASNGFSLIPHQKLQDIYAAMLQCSLLEERIQVLHRKKRRSANIAFTAISEASAVSLLIDLLPGDVVAAAPGDLIAPFLKGVPLKRLLSAAFTSTSKHIPVFVDQKRNVVPSAQDAAIQFAVAAGLALTNKAQNPKQIVVAFADAPQMDSTAWRASLEFASSHNLPVLFICQASTETATAPADSERLGLPIIPVDANDAVAVYRVASESISRARLGRGPTLIECLSCPPDAFGSAEPESPLETMEKYLQRKGLFQGKWKAKIAAQFLRKLDAATTAVRAPE